MILQPKHIAPLIDHVERHHAENGEEGLWFMPPQPLLSVLQTYDVSAWVFAPWNGSAWQRVWGWFDEREHIRGHVVVTGNPLAPHRCALAAGIEGPWRRQGIGRALMAQALAWVCEQHAIDWVDGWAYGHNEPVLKLDAEMGFSELGRVPDVTRLEGKSLDQVILAIDLRNREECLWHSEQH